MLSDSTITDAIYIYTRNNCCVIRWRDEAARLQLRVGGRETTTTVTRTPKSLKDNSPRCCARCTDLAVVRGNDDVLIECVEG